MGFCYPVAQLLVQQELKTYKYLALIVLLTCDSDYHTKIKAFDSWLPGSAGIKFYSVIWFSEIQMPR